MELLPDFKVPLSALAASNADYLVVGGWAVGFHGEPRYTKDLDLLIGLDPANDILRTVPGVDFAEAHARRERVTWEGVPVSMIAFDDLLASKRAAGREKDERDVRALLRSRAPR